MAPPGAKIVYIDGAFDLFHPGHVEILQVRLVHTVAHCSKLLGNASSVRVYMSPRAHIQLSVLIAVRISMTVSTCSGRSPLLLLTASLQGHSKQLWHFNTCSRPVSKRCTMWPVCERVRLAANAWPTGNVRTDAS